MVADLPAVFWSFYRTKWLRIILNLLKIFLAVIQWIYLKSDQLEQIVSILRVE